MDFFSPQEFIWSKKQQKSLVLFLFPIINDWHNTIFFNINFSKEWKINKIPSFSYHASRNFLLGVMWGCSWWWHYHRPLSFLSWDQILDSSISQIIQTKFDFRKKNWVSEGKKRKEKRFLLRLCVWICMISFSFVRGGGLVLFSIIVNNLNWIFFWWYYFLLSYFGANIFGEIKMVR